MIIIITYGPRLDVTQGRCGPFGDYFLRIEKQEIVEDVKMPPSSPSERGKDRIRVQKLLCNVHVDGFWQNLGQISL